MPRSRARTACSACCEDVILLAWISYFFCMIMEKDKVLFICLML